MLFGLVLVLMLDLFARSLVESQLCKDFRYMARRPASITELIRVFSHSEFHCIYICAQQPQCQSILYIASESECFGYLGHGNAGETLDGAVALSTSKCKQIILV